ncbi:MULTISPECIES: hypothetical protein [unclassified Flavobacterium]|jgi:hypothetical protein|uniref:hypothetical protein n=1 Tax=unclassified Flavobacterium TaxID=196869 RepID=UPI00057F885B|nr:MULTISPECIES: hypothetical protein [unclassified Flavobacterium]KIA99523.1 hypothetical protein OA93_05000 [Flavobacterium sp. KMS]KIC01088.1 hypothetical protein OA88_15450 [Flavobacterium sp. JRM]MEA9414260.1 hypothetical protein [Flavobacterium sp. PL02]OUL61860.1 hypothetical protein B8T70_13045 [Flavobacterium sp. AJR]
MKRCALLLLLVTTVSFSQKVVSKIEPVSVEQYEFLQKVNKFYPDIPLTKQITNFYSDDKIIDSKQEFDLKGTPFTDYSLGIGPYNKKIIFDYTTKADGRVHGDISIFKGDVYKTAYYDDNGRFEVFLNGKSVYSKKY